MVNKEILNIAKLMVERLNDELFSEEEKDQMQYAYNIILPINEIMISKIGNQYFVIER